MSTEEHKSDSIYVSWATRKALRLVPRGNDLTSVDALAEKILQDWLKSNHADVVEFLDKQSRAERDFAEKKQAQV